MFNFDEFGGTGVSRVLHTGIVCAVRKGRRIRKKGGGVVAKEMEEAGGMRRKRAEEKGIRSRRKMGR